jgi:TIR domain
MALLVDLPELVGFFSYSREDDEDSRGALSALRDRIQRELRSQLGRSAKTFRLWQDKEAIPSGTLWETEIKNAVAQSVFFIPIITPTVVQSRYCRFELEAFLERETALGRSDLVFPILYIRVQGLDEEARQMGDPVLAIVAKRQYLDWREHRFRDPGSLEVGQTIERFCQNICDALYRSWLSPQEQKEIEEVAARERATAERARRETEARRREEGARKQAEALTLARVEEEKRRRASAGEA